jgi:tungstate transport system substrate-binding protein
MQRMATLNRRTFLALPPALCCAAEQAQAAQTQSLAHPMTLGVDTALFHSGLAAALQKAFGRDTGVAVTLSPGPALGLLKQMQTEGSPLDALLCNAPAAELALDTQGLVHDRHRMARGGFVLVGPAGGAAAPWHALLAALKDTPGAVMLSSPDGAGAQLAEQALWRAAKLTPAAPWHQLLPAGADVLAQARSRRAWAVVERGEWLARGGAPLAVRAEGAPDLAEEVHVMRGFHSKHPAAKLFVAWVSSKGLAVAARHRGYSA